jgi:RHS repeat-associated protein
MYLHAGDIDAPLAMVRYGYGRDTVFFEPFTVYPHADWRGTYSTGTYGSGWMPPAIFVYDTVTHLEQRTEVRIGWPGADTRAYLRVGARPQTEGWMGSLIDEHRDDSGLLYRRNRYYNPEEGRFTQEDPIGLAGGLNLYRYGNADPISYADPFGLTPCSDLRRHIDNLVDDLQGRVMRYIDHLSMGDADSGHRQQVTDRQNQLRRQQRRYRQNKCGDDDDHDDWRGGPAMEALVAWVPPPYQVEGVHGWRGTRGIQRAIETLDDYGGLVNLGPPTQAEIDAVMAMGAAGVVFLVMRAASRVIIKF